MSYAKKLTKEELLRDGINDIVDGVVIRNGYPVQLHRNNQGYLCFNIYAYDDNGNRIKIDKKRRFTYNTTKGPKQSKEIDTYVYKVRMVGLHRAIWAWTYGEVPDGYVVDHISNKHDSLEDYRLDNLQLLSPKQNLAKERPESNRESKCKLDRPREFYEKRLAKYESLYNKAKEEKDAEKAHLLRGNVANTRARLRYFDSHIDEHEKIMKLKKDIEIIKSLKKEFKKKGNLRQWHQLVSLEKNWMTFTDDVREQIMKSILKN